MRIKWNVDEIQKRMQDLQNIAISSESSILRNKALGSMTVYQELLDSSYNRAVTESVDDITLEEALDFLPDILDERYDEVDLCKPLIKLGKSVALTTKIPKQKTLSVSDDTIVDIGLEFFREFDMFYFEEVQKLLKDSHLQFSYGKHSSKNCPGVSYSFSKNSSQDCRGITYSLEFPEKTLYSKCYRENVLGDVIPFVHEMFHAVRLKQGNGKCANDWFQEAEGFLADYLCIDYLAKLDIDPTISFEYYNSVLTALDMANRLEQFLRTDNLAEENPCLAQEALLKVLTSSDGTIQPFIQSFDASLMECLSFMGANDWYNLYQQDPEKMHFYFDRSVRSEEEDLFSYIEEAGFSFPQDSLKNTKQLLKTKLFPLNRK